jgi:hypothetical protein
MNAETNTTSDSRALVVHSDEHDHHSTPVVNNNNSSNNNEIVLDALPYVESLDPNYENYAIQLIEEELQNIETAVNNNDSNSGEHPLLQRLIPSLQDNDAPTAAATDYSMQCPRFGDRAPMAVAAYKALLAKKANNTNGEIDDDKNSNQQHEQQWINQNPDPMATKYGNNNIHEIISSHQENNNVEQQTLITDLSTSITTQKIKLEHTRHQLINLELQQILQTPSTYTHYNTTMLEGQIVNPLSQAVEKQRMEVDTINATRMEEQRGYMKLLEGLNEKYYGLIDKNWRLGEAISDLEGEVERLEK